MTKNKALDVWSEPLAQAEAAESWPPKPPSGEPGSNGSPDVSEQIRDVHAALAQRPERDPVTKRFVVGSLSAGKTLKRSLQFWSAAEPAKRGLVERVRTDLAVDGSSVETLLGLIDAYAEARLFRTSMFLRLVDQGGPITTKGKARALYRAYLDALDRETKLAQVLGLERRAKGVHEVHRTVGEYLERQERTIS